MAAKKKVSKKKPGTAVVSYKEKLAALATQESDRQTVIGGGGTSIKLAKGQFKLNGEELGDTLPVVVLGFVKQKAYYDRPFDEDNPSPPACFAVSPDGKNMAPVGDSPVPQSEACVDCWANEFETDQRQKGKACRDSYHLAVIHADEIGEEEPEIAHVRVPPTSLAAWDSYMVKRNKVLNLPALAFITEMSFDDSVEYQKLVFTEIGRTPEDAFGVLIDLNETVMETLMEPPDFSGYEPPTAGRKKKASKKKTSKKKVAKKASKRKSKFS